MYKFTPNNNGGFLYVIFNFHLRFESIVEFDQLKLTFIHYILYS